MHSVSDNPYSISISIRPVRSLQPIRTAPSRSRSSTPSPTETALRTPPYSPFPGAAEPGYRPASGGDETPTQASVSGLYIKGVRGLGLDMPATTSAASGSSSNRRGYQQPSSPGAGAASGSQAGSIASGASNGGQDQVAGFSDEDEGLVMRDRERDEASVGRSGGVDVGVTRPKRRLSSLPPPQQSPYQPSSSSRTGTSASASTSPPRDDHRYAGSSTGISQTLGGSSSIPGSSAQQQQSQLAFQKMSDRFNMGDGKSAGYSAVVNQTSASGTKDSGGPPKLFGIELKWISLLTLALQNAFLTIIMHYSRVSSSPNKTYSAGAAVLANELLKGTISVFIALRNIDQSMSSNTSPRLYQSSEDRDAPRSATSLLPPRLGGRFSMLLPSRWSALRTAVFSPDCLKLSIPAILYVIQNNLQYTAASNLDVATFQVTYQMKILTTAGFSVLMLGKRLSRIKWLALFLLAVGVGIVQIQSTSVSSHSSAPSGKESIVSQAISNSMSPIKGFMAVTFACITSGLAGVYFELLLKSSGSSSGSGQPDLWVRNTQLSLFSLIPAIVPIMFSNKGGMEGLGPIERLMTAFSNFNGWAIGTVLTQTFGGLVTAIVIRYSDNIMKGFATSLSIIISFLASVALFSYPFTLTFVFGCSIVLGATFLYNAPSGASFTRKDIAIPPGSPTPSGAPILGEPEKPSRASSVMSLIGLSKSGSRGNSRGPSRAPSGDNLRHMAGLSISPTRPVVYHTPSNSITGLTNNAGNGGNGASSHGYASSAPGSPYLSGGYASSTHVSPNVGPVPPRTASPLPPPVKSRRSGSGGSSDSADGSDGLTVNVQKNGAGVRSGMGGGSKPGLRVDVGA